jgi:hypothetical protein
MLMCQGALTYKLRPIADALNSDQGLLCSRKLSNHQLFASNCQKFGGGDCNTAALQTRAFHDFVSPTSNSCAFLREIQAWFAFRLEICVAVNLIEDLGRRSKDIGGDAQIHANVSYSVMRHFELDAKLVFLLWQLRNRAPANTAPRGATEGTTCDKIALCSLCCPSLRGRRR